ncbi:MAG: hypothetical protein KZQ60_18195 [Candidatus Thiodiazotropha sp. (ex Lucinoma aequizonata)]|nr:hypothetical protein [Candidatus Thiodiazotropha sp. (ex Lucinoma aequizonata)]
MHYSIMTIAMTLRRLGCALCMPFISPFRSPFRPCNRPYAYRGLTAFAPLSMAVSERTPEQEEIKRLKTKIWYLRTGTHAPSRCELRYRLEY